MSDTNDQPKDPREHARLALYEAARYAARQMQEYIAAYPDQAKALQAGGFTFAVRIDDVFSLSRSRVSLVTVLQRVEADGQLCSREVEVAHVELSRLGGPGAVTH